MRELGLISKKPGEAEGIKAARLLSKSKVRGVLK